MARVTAWRQGWALASMIVAICPSGVCFTSATSSGPRPWECAFTVMCSVDRAYQNTTHTYCRLHRSETVFCGTRTWNAQQPAPTPRNMQSFFVCALTRQGPREAEQSSASWTSPPSWRLFSDSTQDASNCRGRSAPCRVPSPCPRVRCFSPPTCSRWFCL